MVSYSYVICSFPGNIYSSQTSECGDGEHGVHVFQTNLVGDVCVTDVAVKTGSSGPLQLCISSGYKDKSIKSHINWG